MNTGITKNVSQALKKNMSDLYIMSWKYLQDTEVKINLQYTKKYCKERHANLIVVPSGEQDVGVKGNFQILLYIFLGQSSMLH